MNYFTSQEALRENSETVISPRVLKLFQSQKNDDEMLPERVKKVPYLFIGVMGAVALCSIVANETDISVRAQMGGRATWQAKADLLIAGQEKQLSWKFWEKSQTRPKSYLITTDAKAKAPRGTELIVVEKPYQVFLKARTIAAGMEVITIGDGYFGKSIPSLTGMDGKLGTSFNGAKIRIDAQASDNDEPLALSTDTILKVSAQHSLELSQKWNGVKVTGDYFLHHAWQFETQAGNWLQNKIQNAQIKVEDRIRNFRISAADVIRGEEAAPKQALPSPSGTGSQTSSALPVQSPQ